MRTIEDLRALIAGPRETLEEALESACKLREPKYVVHVFRQESGAEFEAVMSYELASAYRDQKLASLLFDDPDQYTRSVKVDQIGGSCRFSKVK